MRKLKDSMDLQEPNNSNVDMWEVSDYRLEEFSDENNSRMGAETQPSK